MASLYVHIPYCEKKCIYCDFYSIENHASIPEFLRALSREIDSYADEFAARESIETVFFGGGTPSLLPPSQIRMIIDHMRERFTVRTDAEITMEANPGTIDQSAFEGYRRAGVNRMSIGIQSFNPSELAFLGRIHTAEEAARAVRDAYQAGFENVSCDLIFSLPGQTPEGWQETLHRALELGPKHISAYSLIVEEHTPLHAMVARREVVPLEESVDAGIYESTMRILEEHGYGHYEISNYARPGFECRHNLNYWNHANYLGFGPSAHSFWRESTEEGLRWWNERSIARYLEKIGAQGRAMAGSDPIDRASMIEEEIFLGLRCGTLDLAKLEREFGHAFDLQRRSLIEAYEEEGFVTRRDHRLSLTPRGFMMCDAIAEALIGR